MKAPASAPSPDAILECRNVWKVFGPNAEARLRRRLGAPDAAWDRDGLIVALEDVTLSVRRGEVFVVMGLSGSGKSTLVRCMTGLHTTTSGAVELDGEDIARLPARALVSLRRRKIGMVFQDFALLPHLTVLGNVAFPLRVQGMARAERETAARRMVSLVGLEGREGYYPHELSGGQQQRVGIARSLTTQPAIWFLDEPFSALDPLIRREMQAEVLRLQAMLRTTIVFITHDFEEAVRVADRIAIMKDGRVVQVGAPEEFVLNPATDYVAEFTRSIPQEKVLRARSIMGPVDPEADAAAPIEAEARLSEVAMRVVEAEGAVAVIDAEGRVVGALHRRDLARRLL